jgi:hypothetical protein
MGELAKKALETIQKQGDQEIEPTKAQPLPPVGIPYTRIWSNLVQEIIWVVGGIEEVGILVQRGTKEVIYTADEIKQMKDFTPEEVKAVHATKKVFPGATITEV